MTMYWMPGELGTARAEFEATGYHRAPRGLDDAWLTAVRRSVTAVSGQRRPEVVYEEGTNVVRALHGCHRFDENLSRLVRLPALVDLAEELVGDAVYVYQFKVNLKRPREGKAWPWHQDFAFWHHEDGMRRADAVNLAVFLDEVDERNGPLTVLSGSHLLGLLDGAGARQEEPDGHDWRRDVSAKLTYTVSEDTAAELARDHQRVRITGDAGSVVAFHPNIVHSSSHNLSDQGRAILLVTYNAVGNPATRLTRPEFLVSRDTRPLVRLDDHDLAPV